MHERLRKADWRVESIEHADAVAFLRSIHYARGAANTSVYRHGLFRRDPAVEPLLGPLLGVAFWMPPTRRAAESVSPDWRGVLVLSRFACADEVPPNGESFLLGRSMRGVDRRRWPVLLTYADGAHDHVGTIYRATNWRCLGETPAGDVWVNDDGVQRGRKRGPRCLSAEEMRAAGFRRVEAASKIKFVHP